MPHAWQVLTPSYPESKPYPGVLGRCSWGNLRRSATFLEANQDRAFAQRGRKIIARDLAYEMAFCLVSGLGFLHMKWGTFKSEGLALPMSAGAP